MCKASSFTMNQSSGVWRELRESTNERMIYLAIIENRLRQKLRLGTNIQDIKHRIVLTPITRSASKFTHHGPTHFGSRLVPVLFL